MLVRNSIHYRDLAHCLFGLVVLAILPSQSSGLDKNYEYIVVGAGSAGSIVASKLARSGASVLLIEAGSDNSDPNIEDLKSYFDVAFNQVNYGWAKWGYETVNQTFSAAQEKVTPRPISLPRGKILGGTHSINACAYVQANSEDFNGIAELLGDSDWEWKNTKKFRTELEETLGIVNLGRDQVGAEEFIDSASEVLGFPFNDDPTKGYQYGISSSYWTAQQTPKGGRRRSTFESFVIPLIDDQFSEGGKQLEYKKGSSTKDGPKKDRPQKDSPKKAGSKKTGSKKTGSKDRRGLGFLEIITHHLATELIFDSNDRTRVRGVSCYNTRTFLETNFTASKEVIISAGTYNSPKLLLLSGIGPTAHLSEVGIPTKVNLPGVGSNLRDHYGVATFWALKDLTETNPFLFQSPSMNMFGPEKKGLTTFQLELSGNFGSCVPLRQQSTGSVRLQNADYGSPPIIDPNVLSVEIDIDELVECLEDYLLPFFGDLVKKGLLAQLTIGPTAETDEIRRYVLDNVSSNHHPVGTCKIGPASDPMAVVDGNFRVYGTSNLRVVDGSIFPLTPSGNINAPIMTAALIGAEKIIEDS